MKTAYFRYYFGVFFTWSCTNSLITVYLNEQLGIAASQVGFFMSFIPLITLTFQPIWGALSDQLGNRKKVLRFLIVMTFLLAVSMTLLSNPLAGMACYALFMVFLSGQNPISDSMTIRFVSMEANAGSFGAIRSWGSIGYAVGAFAVARLSDVFGLKMVFYIAAVGYILGFALLTPLNAYPTLRQKRSYLQDLGSLIKNRQYTYILIYTFFLIGIFFSGEQFIFMYTRSMGIPLKALGTITAVSVVVEIPFIFYSKRLMERFGETALIFMITLASALRLGILSMSTGYGYFLAAGAIRGVVVGIFIPLFVEMIGDITPKEIVASAISIYTAVSTGIATFIFTIAGSAITAIYGYQALYGLYAMMTLMLVAVNLLHRKSARKGTEKMRS
ncbi:MFS transporter [Fusibacter paucivorans]|uniref:MFS transporter n=1 Tax=Fusibacter paucivorans TaxID=76009 RepID=A0ABS5PVR3_9FIRM|nr:MFS transporter [Fusibacter paucivorans]MBS7528636.1 MFS transporter [Fusibacter paucivorans]